MHGRARNISTRCARAAQACRHREYTAKREQTGYAFFSEADADDRVRRAVCHVMRRQAPGLRLGAMTFQNVATSFCGIVGFGRATAKCRRIFKDRDRSELTVHSIESSG
jgi:hypothetical protein